MDAFIIAYIQNRMQMLGISVYQFEPKLIVYPGVELMGIGTSPNDYYYLVSKELKPGTTIKSANNNYRSNENYNYSPYANIQEFNGPEMRISSPPGTGPQFIEFIRVITTV